MTIKGLLLIAGSLGIGMIAADAASAASPAYCALYSREYAVTTVQPSAAPGMLQSIQDQAYYRCLNMDEDPPFPQTSAYFGTKLPATPTTTTGSGSTASVDTSDTSTIVPPIPRPAPAAPPKTVVTASAPKSTAPTESRGGGRQPWTEEWMAYCAKYFPNSWDPKTGTILHYGSDTRELCK